MRTAFQNSIVRWQIQTNHFKVLARNALHRKIVVRLLHLLHRHSDPRLPDEASQREEKEGEPVCVPVRSQLLLPVGLLLRVGGLERGKGVLGGEQDHVRFHSSLVQGFRDSEQSVSKPDLRVPLQSREPINEGRGKKKS